MAKGKISIFKDRLAKMQDGAAAAMATYTPGGVTVPDSIYIAKEGAELAESQSSGNLMITRTFTIAEGEQKGLRIWDHIVMERVVDGERMLSDIGIQQARRWVEIHGIDWPEDNLGALEEIVATINDANMLCKIKSKTTKSKTSDDMYTNVTVMEMYAEGSEEVAGDSPAKEPAAKEPAADEEAGRTTDELDGMTRAELKAFITENELDIRVTIKTSDDDIRAAIREALGQATEAEDTTSEEGVPVEDLLAFCASQGISEVEEGMEAAAVIEVMATYQYKQEELTEDELAMLVAAGIPDTNIIAPPPPLPKAAPRPAPKAPAPKSSVPPKATAAPVARPALPKLGAGKARVLSGKK